MARKLKNEVIIVIRALYKVSQVSSGFFKCLQLVLGKKLQLSIMNNILSKVNVFFVVVVEFVVTRRLCLNKGYTNTIA